MKTYTVELNELEIAALVVFAGYVSGKDDRGTFRETLSNARDMMRRVSGIDWDNSCWYENFKKANPDFSLSGGFGASPLVEKVRLNGAHTATVTKDGIKVGCHTFPLSVIEDLVKARDSL